VPLSARRGSCRCEGNHAEQSSDATPIAVQRRMPRVSVQSRRRDMPALCHKFFVLLAPMVLELADALSVCPNVLRELATCCRQLQGAAPQITRHHRRSNRYCAPVCPSDRIRCMQDAPSPPAGRAAAAVTELKPRGQQAPCSAAGRAGTQLPCCAQPMSSEAHSINERAVRHTLHSSMAILHPRAPCPTLLGVAAMCEVRLIPHAALREALGRREQRRRFSASKFAARQPVEHARMRQMP
jgi:hypothetical protein